jgi:hypothetical protein
LRFKTEDNFGLDADLRTRGRGIKASLLLLALTRFSI